MRRALATCSCTIIPTLSIKRLVTVTVVPALPPVTPPLVAAQPVGWVLAAVASTTSIATFHAFVDYANEAQGIRAAGLDPDQLPVSDPSKMNFGGDAKKAWKDIWGCGQGIGAIDKLQSAGEYIAQLRREYQQARARLLGSVANA